MTAAVNVSWFAVGGPVAVIASIVFGVLSYRRSRQLDRATENAAVIAAQTGSYEQALDAFKSLAETWKADAKEWRERFKEMDSLWDQREDTWRKRVTDCGVELAAALKETSELQKLYDALCKKYLAVTKQK